VCLAGVEYLSHALHIVHGNGALVGGDGQMEALARIKAYQSGAGKARKKE